MTAEPKLEVRKARSKIGPVKIHFDNVTYTVDNGKKLGGKKTLLNNISASFEPGSLTAIMGASGAGKTTMLNMLAGRSKNKKPFSLEGTVHVNGTAMKKRYFQYMSAYVMQDDVMMPHLTVREQIQFNADLKLKDMTLEERRERVEEVIRDIGLSACSNTKVGLSGIVRGVSGGERKRTAIACEIVHNPQLVFLDEPTTGLDSETAITVMEMLADLARSGKTIAATIHQPSSEIFALFDNLLLLSMGEIVYYGPASKAMEYFTSIGHPCPAYANPADFFMKVLVQSKAPEQSDEKYTHQYLVAKWKDCEISKAMAGKITPPPVVFDKSMEKMAAPFFCALLSSLLASFVLLLSPLPALHLAAMYRALINPAAQVTILLRRSFLNYIRDRRHTVDNGAAALIMAIIIGLVFLRLGHDQPAIQDRAGVLFFLAIFNAFSALNSALFLFPEERPVFLREYAKGMYGVASYFISKNLAELPAQLFFPVMSCAVAYYMIGLNPGPGHFFTFVGITELLTCAVIGLGLCVGAAVSDNNQASALGPIILMPFMLFGGLFLNAKNTPKYFIWIEKTSVFKYAYHSLMINEMRGASFYCKEGQYIGVNGTECPFTTGAEVLDSYSIDLDLWSNALILIALMLFIRFVAFICLFIFAKRHRANA